MLNFKRDGWLVGEIERKREREWCAPENWILHFWIKFVGCRSAVIWWDSSIRRRFIHRRLWKHHLFWFYELTYNNWLFRTQVQLTRISISYYLNDCVQLTSISVCCQLPACQSIPYFKWQLWKYHRHCTLNSNRLTPVFVVCFHLFIKIMFLSKLQFTK